MDRPEDLRLADVLADLAMVLLTETSLKADLERLVRLASQLIADCSGASVSMIVDGEPSTVAVTDRVSLEIDVVQYENADGPCVTALGGPRVRVAFIPEDGRFPHFAIGAADRRVLSVLSLPAIDHGLVVGSLNLYSRRANAFDQTAEDTGLVFAAEIANAVVKSALLRTARTTREELQEKHDESVLVSMAKGILMVVHECSAAQAGELIRAAADSNGEQLITAAERILASVREDPTLIAEVEDGP
jgi:transcriptional regulator with GAF, ATPase, and Fis domain